MKRKFTVISRFAVCAVATTLACSAAYAQMNDDQPTSGEDVSGHPTTDSPYLRAKSKPAASAGQQQAAAKLSQKDQKFLSQIAAGGAQAVADSKVAQQQGGASVKNAASRVVSERSKSNAELQALAKKKGLSLGTDKIKARSMGKNFDKQYVHTLSRDLQEDVKLLQGAANSSDDKDIKAWAGKTLPSVKGELNAVQSAGK